MPMFVLPGADSKAFPRTNKPCCGSVCLVVCLHKMRTHTGGQQQYLQMVWWIGLPHTPILWMSQHTCHPDGVCTGCCLTATPFAQCFKAERVGSPCWHSLGLVAFVGLGVTFHPWLPCAPLFRSMEFGLYWRFLLVPIVPCVPCCGLGCCPCISLSCQLDFWLPRRSWVWSFAWPCSNLLPCWTLRTGVHFAPCCTARG